MPEQSHPAASAYAAALASQNETDARAEQVLSSALSDAAAAYASAITAANEKLAHTLSDNAVIEHRKVTAASAARHMADVTARDTYTVMYERAVTARGDAENTARKAYDAVTAASRDAVTRAWDTWHAVISGKHA